MAQLIAAGRLQTGRDEFDFGVRALYTQVTANGAAVFAATGPSGGITSYTVSVTGAVSSGRRTAFTDTVGVADFNADFTVLDDMTLVLSGMAQGRMLSYDMSGSGQLSNLNVMSLPSGAASRATTFISDTEMVAAAQNGDGFEVFRANAAGNWTLTDQRGDTQSTYGREIGAMAHYETAQGADIIIAGSAAEQGITSYRMTDNGVSIAASIGSDNGPGIMIPTVIEVVEAYGQSYVVVGSAAKFGASGALTMLAVGAQGGMQVLDHLLDGLNTRFGMVQALATLEVNGRPLLVAGGGDGGITLMSILPGGQLVHLDTIEAEVDTPLLQITDIALAHTGSVLSIFVATQSGRGVSVVTYDTSGIGQLVQDGGQGGSRDDIVMDAAGVTTLEGGNGADIFIMSRDRSFDRIEDFNPAEDTIDLSHWPFFYSADQLDIRQQSGGIRIIFREETLEVRGASGVNLTVESVRAAIHDGPTRTVLPGAADGMGPDFEVTLADTGSSDPEPEPEPEPNPQPEPEPNPNPQPDPVTPLQSTDETGTNDTIEGTSGADTINSGGGDDLIFGSAGEDELMGALGDDVIYGGADNDTISGGWGNDTIYGDAGNDLIKGSRGDDELHGISGVNKIVGQSGADVLIGGDERDVLNGGGGWDLLFGNAGNDRLKGGPRRDELSGGQGPDMLFGNAGSDFLMGGNDDDLLNGGGDNDTLNGGRHDDLLKGGGGADTFVFHKRMNHDTITDFELGVDILSFSNNLFDGNMTASAALSQFARQDGDHVVFEFNDEDKITLLDMRLTSDLSDDINIG